ncbi:ABC transporter permease [Paenisporosarcina sp. TG-14]|uniref:ABC transporter permease n=1 Tax=Paenisporosarcina sp. TG-14 TaxID=1231057 RepID=UPI0002DF9395|nr:ABC transporter permease [Paenisporosarcina sp. TG-14]
MNRSTTEMAYKKTQASISPQRQKINLLFNNVMDFSKKLVRHPSACIGAIVISLFMAVAIFAPWIAPHSAVEGDLMNRFVPPFWVDGGSAKFILGTDSMGMDLLSRIIWGARVSMTVGIIAISSAMIIGTTLGLIAGYFRGWFDTILCRISELMSAFPFLIFAIAMMAFLGPGFWNLILALVFISWIEFFRVVRGEIMNEKTKEYVEAAVAIGRSHFKVMVSEVLPNIIHSILVLATLRLGFLIIMEASLSFLGLGIQPPTAAWGSMISAGRDYMLNAWWITTLPGIALIILILSINLLGEGLRDILDPRLKSK